MTRLALVGGGRMGTALLHGLLAAGWEADDLVVAEADPERRRELEAAHPSVRLVPSPAWAVPDARVVVVAVKPGDVEEVLEAARPALAAGALVVSVAAGVTIAHLERLVPGHAVVRAMPNTAAVVGRSATVIAGGALATDLDLSLAEQVLRSVGIVERAAEALLDAVTGLTGSGPAYVFLVAESLVEAGVLEGIPRATAERLVEQLLLGAATMLVEGHGTAHDLRFAVTSPGGTTAAGLHALERGGVRAAFLDAVRAATDRSRALGRSTKPD